MYAKRLGRGMGPNQYSHEFHLARSVVCVQCGAHLHKDHFYVYYGNRCRPCWQVTCVSSGVVAQMASHLPQERSDDDASSLV